tara:strand:- start:784 stop:1800 length:1017 start_codon:yes stop_codon:yes gene_type:complete
VLQIKMDYKSNILFFFIKNISTIKKYILITLLFSVTYSFFSKVYFKSEISLYPAGELSTSTEIFSDFKDVIESFGFEATNTDNNFYIPDIIESRRLRKEIIYKKWNTTKFSSPVNLIEYWELKDLNIFNKIILFINNSFNSYDYNPKLKYEEDAVDLLEDLIYVDENNSGLIEVEILMDEPQLAADIANFISDYVIKYVGEEQKIFAKKTKVFLRKMLDSADNDLKMTETDLTIFKKNNPLHLDTPETQLERIRLIRKVEVNQEVYITIRKQYELSKIEESKERLFVNILDNAKPSLYKEYPKRFIIILSFTFLGTLLLILTESILFRLKDIINQLDN